MSSWAGSHCHFHRCFFSSSPDMPDRSWMPEGPAWHGPDVYIRDYDVMLASDVDFTKLFGVSFVFSNLCFGP